MSSVDLQLVKKGLDYTRKRKKWAFVFAALGFTSYSVYKVYHSPSVVRKRKRLSKLFSALISVAEMVFDSAEAIGVVAKDLKEFIQSDSDQIPNSLRQICKISRSDEFSESLIMITRALTVGILRGYRSEVKKGGDSRFSDRVLDKLFTPAGSGFASVVVGSLARNLVIGFYSERQYGGGSKLNGFTNVENFDLESPTVPRWVDVVCGEKCRELIGDCIQVIVSTAVTVYLDRTMNINTYDEIFSGLTNPKHETKVREMLAAVCNGAVETLVRTSHQVLTSPNSNSYSSYLPVDLQQGLNCVKQTLDRQESISIELKARKLFDKNQSSGWVSKMSSTLAVPSNRRFVLDVTGRVTFETVRSFLEFLVEKISDALRRSLNVFHEEVVDRGLEFYRYFNAKTSTVVTICVSLCLHILNGPWDFVPT
ncbi:unnamed protein product [Ilex paraguariensis]|uniref:Protein PHLOEM PROTEIN 2-LIKE A10 n=1 Tax=Ilex paraguariensis TaxID=185542 RepID=A0ABC8SHI2_9AQUA